MGQQRTLGIKPPSFHHHADAVQRQLLQSTALLRLDLSRQPHEALVLPKLFLKLIASDLEHRGKMTGDGRWTLQRRRHTKYRWHFHIHREYFAMPIRYHASGAFKRYGLLMLPIGLSRKFGCLKHLERNQSKENNAEPAQEQEQQHIATTTRRAGSHSRSLPVDSCLAKRTCSTGGSDRLGVSAGRCTINICPCGGGTSPSFSVATFAIRSGAVNAEDFTCN